MNIYEAAKIAKEHGWDITRNHKCFHWGAAARVSLDDPHTLWIKSTEMHVAIPLWEPGVEDLLAEDWEPISPDKPYLDTIPDAHREYADELTKNMDVFSWSLAHMIMAYKEYKDPYRCYCAEPFAKKSRFSKFFHKK